MSAPVFSVVIPTRDRAGVLERTLGALEQQQDAPAFEIVVVDDGSTDDTVQMLNWRSFRRPHQVVSQSRLGPAQARNAGVDRAQGEWLGFLGSDTIPATRWLAEHWRHHRDGTDVAVVGRTCWHPRLPRSHFLDYINEMGLQFGYALIDDPNDVPFNFFYSSNLTLHRSWLQRQRFDARFPGPAWEDVELGYRLTRAGLRLVYEPDAGALHDHRVDIASFLRRQQRVGRSAILLRDKHPELCHFLGLPPEGPPPAPSPMLLSALERLARAIERWPLRTPWLWRYLSNAHYRRGCVAANV